MCISITFRLWNFHVYAVKLSRLGCETSTVIVKKSAFKFDW